MKPPAGPDAPKGWTWNRAGRVWQPKQRGPEIWAPADQRPPAAAAADYPFPWAGVKQQQEQLLETPAPGERDPAPGWQNDPAPGRAGQAKLPFEQVPQQVKDDIAGLAGLVGTPILALARTIDPYCGGALADAYEGVLDATLPLICRSEKIIKYFSEDTADWLLWGKLALALAPVGKAIAEHHVFRTVKVVRDETTGAVSIVRTAGPDAGMAQHLTPPAVDPERYAA